MPFKKNIRVLLFLLFPLQLFAQDITGVWKGEFYVDSIKKVCPFELSISEDKGKLTGYSRISFEEDGIAQVVFWEHSINKEGDNYIITDKDQLSKASSVAQPREVKKTMIVVLAIQDSTMTLKGNWSTNRTRRFLAAHGTVEVQRKNDFKQTALFKKLDELSLAKYLSFNVPEKNPDPVLTKKEAIVAAPVMVIKTPEAPATVKAAPPVAVNIPAPERPKEPVVIKEEPKPVIKTPEPVAIKTTPPKPKAPVAKAETRSQPIVKAAERPTAVKNAPAVIAKPVITINKPLVVAPPKPIPAQAVASVTKNAAVEVDKRTNSSIQSLYYKTDSLQLTLYDNGEIDGDTVSVLLNGKVIIAKQGLNTRPNVHTIYFDKDTPDSMMLVMYAENLGSIPPNTGLLVVHDGKAIYEVRFSADLSSNAAIILRRKREE